MIPDFNAERHEYRVGGVIVPHVTGVLAPLVDYSMVPRETLERARLKGNAVHKMVEIHAKGLMGEYDFPPWMAPVIAYWERFVAETGLELFASERRVYHAAYGYAGTLDLRCRLTKTKLKGTGILDIKRSFMGGKTIGLQTAAYGEADDESGDWGKDRVLWRAALRLREDQPYRMRVYPDKADFSRFLTCLSFHRLKEQLQ